MIRTSRPSLDLENKEMENGRAEIGAKSTHILGDYFFSAKPLASLLND